MICTACMRTWMYRHSGVGSMHGGMMMCLGQQGGDDVHCMHAHLDVPAYRCGVDAWGQDDVFGAAGGR